MTKEHLTTNLSDKEIIRSAFTNPKIAKSIIDANGSESFFTDLLAVVNADTTSNHKEIGIAIRAVLGEQFDPIIKAENFQNDLEKDIKATLGRVLGSVVIALLPKITSTDDLINLIIRNTNNSSIKKAIRKVMPGLANSLHEMRIEQQQEKELELLTAKTNRAAEAFVKASEDLKELTTSLNDESEDNEDYIHDTVAEICSPEAADQIISIISKSQPLTKEDVDTIKGLIPDEDLYNKHFGKLEGKVESKDKAGKVLEDCNEERLQHDDNTATQVESKSSNAETYVEVVQGIFDLGTITCASSMESKESSPVETHSIKAMLSNGDIPIELREKLGGAIKIIEAAVSEEAPESPTPEEAEPTVSEESPGEPEQEAEAEAPEPEVEEEHEETPETSAPEETAPAAAQPEAAGHEDGHRLSLSLEHGLEEKPEQNASPQEQKTANADLDSQAEETEQEETDSGPAPQAEEPQQTEAAQEQDDVDNDPLPQEQGQDDEELEQEEENDEPGAQAEEPEQTAEGEQEDMPGEQSSEAEINSEGAGSQPEEQSQPQEQQQEAANSEPTPPKQRGFATMFFRVAAKFATTIKTMASPKSSEYNEPEMIEYDSPVVNSKNLGLTKNNLTAEESQKAGLTADQHMALAADNAVSKKQQSDQSTNESPPTIEPGM